ncbi:MAG: YbhB/YbcL family Raf kinase inhibitor-like protein [Elusimicrobia bacterium]|nr:YbhB/YbcL family Raf kinase inhibitor-like protein [Elusimicrobiota bacterium]
MSFTLTSPAFKAGGTIPKVHTCDGEDVSPMLRWTAAPAGTKSLALIVDDPDAPPGTWVHWLLYDIPGAARELPKGIEKQESLPIGARQGACWGVDKFERVGYYGPCPPPGKPHRYYFKLFALDKMLHLKPRATKTELIAAMEGHVLASAELMGKYGR